MSNINEIISKARDLMLNEEFNEKVESIADRHAGRVFNPNKSNVSSIREEINNTNSVANNIIESFSKMPPIQGSFNNPNPTYGYNNYNNSSIDYNYIKFIVKEALKENNPDESSYLKGIKFLEGNKIIFVDTKGNVYEATLKLKKKANSK